VIFSSYRIVWRRFVRHFVENGRHPRTGKWHTFCSENITEIYFDTTKSTHLVLDWNLFFTIFKTNRHPRSIFIMHTVSLSFPNGFYTKQSSILRILHVFLLFFNHLRSTTFQAEKRCKRRLRRTSSNPKHFKYCVKKNMRHCYLFQYYEAHKEVSKAKRNRSTLIIVLVTSKCFTTTSVHDRCGFGSI